MENNMDLELWISLIATIAMAGYLFYAMMRPEKF